MVTTASRRIEKLKEKISQSNLDGVVILHGDNRRYYSGFSGSNGILIISSKKNYLITDGRYQEQAAIESPDFEIVMISREEGKDLMTTFSRLLSSIEIGKNLGFEADTVSVKSYDSSFKKLTEFNFIPADDIIRSFRYRKEPDELNEIRKAIEIAEKSYREIEQMFAAGVTERRVAAELEYYMRMNGAMKASFDVIVGSGPNSALPHAKVSDRVFQLGDSVVIDWGAISESGYCSDMTRTIFIGRPNDEMLSVYRVVYGAQLYALDAVKPGVTTGELDSIARKIITDAGYGEYFSHGLGHGVGTVVHEGISVSEGRTEVLEPGMVITIEPGIYLPGKGGVRIEDMVLVTETGSEILTSLPKINY
jgi:Xaa-Pro aminopeptidase